MIEKNLLELGKQMRAVKQPDETFLKKPPERRRLQEDLNVQVEHKTREIKREDAKRWCSQDDVQKG